MGEYHRVAPTTFIVCIRVILCVPTELPQNLLRFGQVNGWQCITKDCQRYLTGKECSYGATTPLQNNSGLNTKLNVKKNNTNKSLFTL
jgi:hypothetical protein